MTLKNNAAVVVMFRPNPTSLDASLDARFNHFNRTNNERSSVSATVHKTNFYKHDNHIFVIMFTKFNFMYASHDHKQNIQFKLQDNNVSRAREFLASILAFISVIFYYFNIV